MSLKAEIQRIPLIIMLSSLVIVVGSWLLMLKTPLIALPVMMLFGFISAWLIIRFEAVPILMKTMALLLPFSLEVPFIMDSMLRLPTEPLIVLSVMVLILDFLMHPGTWKGTPGRELLWLLPLVGALLLTIPFSGMPFVSVKFSMVNILYMLGFYVMIMRLSMKSASLFPQMVFLYGLGVVLVMFWALVQYGLWDWNPVVVRGIFQPFYKDHTIFGASAAMLAAFWLGAAMTEELRGWRLMAFFTAVLFLMGVLLSTSRGAFLSLLAFGSVILIFHLKPRPLHVLASVALLVVLSWSLTGTVIERFDRVESLSYDSEARLVERTRSVANVSTDVSNIERLNRWVSAWRMFLERPLTGFGPGTYQFEYIPYQKKELMNRLSVTNPWSVPEGSGGTAHSEYLLALSEMGVFGLLGWLLLMGRWIWMATSRWRTHPQKKYLMVALAALSTYFFHALVNNFLTTDKFAFLFWGMAAWLVANYHKKDETVLSTS